MNEGAIASNVHPAIPVTDYQQHFTEVQVPHSTALQSVRWPQQTTYLVGPLARLNLNFDRLLPQARRVADEIGLVVPVCNPYRSLLARCIEVVHAFEEALAILRELDFRGPCRMAYAPQHATGCAATEAPRGLLYHEYEIDAHGKIARARIIPPTSQNQRQIESDLRQQLQLQLAAGLPRDQLALHAERLVRSYDPCISCATHFLRVQWEDT